MITFFTIFRFETHQNCIVNDKQLNIYISGLKRVKSKSRMCSFMYGCALSKPILGPYFELPRKFSTQRNLMFDSEYRDITDVSAITREKKSNMRTQIEYYTFTHYQAYYFHSIGFCISIHGYGTICRQRY